MGLDLELFSISNKAKFVLDKAKLKVDYANDFDKIQDTDNLKLHLKMVQANPYGTPEYILQELIEDSKIVLSHYPDNKTNNYQFHSATRGYETLNYLLSEYLKDIEIRTENEKIFYEGTDILQTQFPRLQYFDNMKTVEISNLLQPIDFSDIVKFYDYQKMETAVYKCTRPENLEYLKTEFEDLKIFFREATKLDAFVIIKVS